MAKKDPDEEQTDNAELDFETALKELEALVAKLEQGELSLEDSLRSFERGIALTRSCQQALRGAEQKVETLVQDESQSLQAVPFQDEQQD